MRRKNTAQLLAALLAALTLLVSGCGEKQEAADEAFKLLEEKLKEH